MCLQNYSNELPAHDETVVRNPGEVKIGTITLSRILTIHESVLKKLAKEESEIINSDSVTMSLDAHLKKEGLSIDCLKDADLSNIDLRNADLRFLNLKEANLSRSILERANLGNVNLKEADLTEANLKSSNLSESNLKEANLTRADLSNANLKRSNLKEANVEKARINGANLDEVDIHEAESLTIQQLLSVRSLRKAILPETLLIVIQKTNPALLGKPKKR